MYNHKSSSNTSLSDEYDDDEAAKSTLFVGQDNQPLAVAPAPAAHWASKSSTTTSSDFSPISLVPPEILINIFKHVTSTRDLLNSTRVSRTWCDCAIEFLWHKPNFPKYGTMVKMGRVLTSRDQTFTYARFIRRLNLMGLSVDLKDEVLFQFMHCDRLERLTLVNCKGVSGELLNHLLARYRHLIAIDLTGCSQVTNNALVGLSHTAQGLQGINLAGCTRVTDDGILALARHCSQLRRVKLSNVHSITDTAVIALAKSCPLLLEIDLNFCSQITDVGVRSLWQHSSCMREMRLSYCSEITDAAFPSPPRIEANALPDINPFPTTVEPGKPVPPLVLNRTFDHIRMLDLTACSKITDDAIEGIISHAPKIRNLVLSKCTLLTDRAVEAISKLSRSLHYLHLGHANKITDKSIRTLARSCTRLRYIDFANCTHLTDMSVFELSSLPKLRRVGLVRVNNLTDEAIYALAERHATLERIHLSYCDQITVMAIHFLLQKLHKLTHLSLTGIPAFRNPELQKFCREAPKEFNSAQRMAFCVYSGKGISQLRNFLTELFDNMNETNGTDDTEYEEDEYEQHFNEDGTPEPDGEEVDGDANVGQDVIVGQNLRSGRSGAQPQAHEFVFNRDRPQRTATIPTSTISAGRNGSNVPPSVNIYGATSRLNAQILDGTAIPVSGASRRGRQPVAGQQTITDVLPVVETPSGSSLHTTAAANGSSPGGLHQPSSAHSSGQPGWGHEQEGMVVDTINNGMDVDQWTNVEAGSSTVEYGQQMSEEASNWNMRRTLRDVFHFGRNPLDNLPQLGGSQPRR